MRIICKEPGKAPEYIDIENELKPLQKAVGGYIETLTLEDDWTIVCNEEGRLRGLPWNVRMFGLNLYGTILFIGVDGPEFTDCPLTLEDLRDLYGVA